MNSWFEVDREGLRQLMEGRDKSFVVRELVQNAWDEPGVTRCDVTLEPIEKGMARLTVEDDAPEGFQDIRQRAVLRRFGEAGRQTGPVRAPGVSGRTGGVTMVEPRHKGPEMLTLRVPRRAWGLLASTLAMDSKSKAFDKALRRRIADALRQVRQVGEPYILVAVTSGVPEVDSVFWQEAEAIQAARRLTKSLRPDNDIVVVTRGGGEVFGWPKE